MKKITGFFILLIILLLVLSGLLIKEISNRDNKIIKIGFIAPLSGDLVNPVGLSHQQGLLLGEEDYFKNKNIKVFHEDDKGSKIDSINAARHLIDFEDVKILISPLSPSSFALAPVVKEKNVILFSTAGNPNIAKQNENIFRFFASSAQEGIELAEFAEKNLDIKTIGILFQMDDFSISEKDAFKIEFEKRHMKSLGEEAYESGATDVKTQVSRIINKNPDAILFAGNGIGLVTAIKTVREFDFDGLLLSGGNIAYPPLSTDYKDLVEGMYAADFKFDTENPSVKAFVEKFKVKYDAPKVYPNSAIEYATVQILMPVIDFCGDNIGCIREKLLSSEFETIMGKIKFDKDGEANTPVIVKHVVDGEYKIV